MITLSSFQLTREYAIFGTQVTTWADYMIQVGWSAVLLDNGMLKVTDSTTGDVAYLGAAAVGVAVEKRVPGKAEALEHGRELHRVAVENEALPVGPNTTYAEALAMAEAHRAKPKRRGKFDK